MLTQRYAAMPTTATPGSLASRWGFAQGLAAASAQGICFSVAIKREAARHLGNVWPLSLSGVSSG